MMVRTILKSKGIYTGSEFIEKGAIIVENNIVKEITNSPYIDKTKDDIKDFSNHFIIPLLCDYHLHFQSKKSFMETIHQLRSYGISTAFEGGDPDLSGIKAKKEGVVNRFYVKTSGAALYKSGGYGGFLGRGVNNTNEAKIMIKKLYSLNVDYIKIVNSGIFLPESNTITDGGFKADELSEMIGFCNHLGLDVYCHANGERAIREAVLAGAKAIIHGFFPSQATISLISDRGVIFIPTLYALKSLKTIYKTQKARDNLSKAEETHMETIRRSIELKVKVLPGSDSGPFFIPYGKACQEEAVLLRQLGMTIDDLVKSSKINQISQGNEAAFLLFNGSTFTGPEINKDEMQNV